MSQLEGVWSVEKVCLYPGDCTQTDVFLMEEDVGFGELTDGILGLALPDRRLILAPELTKIDNRSILKNLDLSFEAFSINFSKEGNSFLDFGIPR